MDVFWNATEAFGDLLIEKMNFVGLELTFWFWFLFAIGMWLNNLRSFVRQLRLRHRRHTTQDTRKRDR